MATGIIKELKNGYGFITGDNGQQYHFSYGFVKNMKPALLKKGMKITFDPGEKSDLPGWPFPPANNVQIIYSEEKVRSSTPSSGDKRNNKSKGTPAFHNPYNFVHYLPPCQTGEDAPRDVKLLRRCRPPGHDRYVGLNGRINCVLTAATPLFISDSQG
ncbi:cold-shock protein, partial [Syntrophomonas wolfei]|uniref:cold-shock protein n=1 Tax=Syntrophomonas wolfei TaxID=863 RepID=UPI0023F356D5